jgi:hypothetical protein
MLMISLAAVLLSDLTNAQDTLHPQELRAVAYGRSKQRLRDIPSAPVNLAAPHQAEPIHLNPNLTVRLGPIVPDPLLAIPAQKVGAVLRSHPPIEGIGNGMTKPPYQIQMAPPDTNGAVGESQFVQWVNNSIAVFNKKTHELEGHGPLPGNFLWKNFGGNCEENNNGDPVVQYDKLARRWVLAQFSVTNGKDTGYSECIAISTSSDAMGYYWLYEFQYPAFDDYPKIGVWPDGYYASFNMYDVTTGTDGKDVWQYLGARACVYDRRSMLAGRPGKQECFQLSTDYFGLLPSDLDGPNLPPPAAGNYFVALGAKPDTLDLWRFKADWRNPRSSTFGTGPYNSPNVTLPVAHYNLACGGNGTTCIPQPHKADSQEQLDSLGDRLMFRAAYRRFHDHESLVLNHSVDTGGDTSRTAVRWYELRDLDKDVPVVFQQGTFTPDTSHRWMGSIAMDGNGNMALGYNVSGETVSPGIRIAARLSNDPKGAIGNESSVKEGTGVQTCAPGGACQCPLPGGSAGCDKLTRWGDYSAITLDPADDCTFWYTGEYQATDGAYNWHTGIVSFTIEGACPVKRH